MNAIKFIKEHGVEKAREVVEGAPDGATHLSDDACHYVNADFKPLPAHIKEQLPELIVINDLKRLVDSLDLVKSYGGIINAKHDVKYLDLDWDYDTPRVTRLKQAIADYELIYSNDMGDDSHIENHVSPLCHHHWVDGLDGGTMVCAHKCGAWK